MYVQILNLTVRHGCFKLRERWYQI